jgi:ferredoxin
LKGRSVLEPLQGGSDVDVVSQATYTSVAVIDAARLTGIRMLQQLSGLYGEKIEAVETPPSGDKHFDFKVLVPLLLLLLGVWLDRTQSKVSEGHASSRQSEGFAAVERSVPESERMQSKVSEGHSIPASHRAGSVPESERMQSKVSEGHSIPASHRAGSVPESERRRWSWLRNAALLLSLLLLGGYLQSFFSIQQGLDLVLKLRGALTGQLSFPELPQLAIWYVLILVALGSALLGGRFYCNTVCPFGALSELAGRLSRHRIRLPARVEKQALRLKFVVLFTLAVLFSASQDARFFAIEPFADTFTFAFLDEAMTAIWIGLLLLASLLLPRAFCRYLCPAGAMMAFLSCHRLVRRARPDKCEGCGECIVVCERRVQAGIKREAAALRDQGPWVKASEASAETASAAQQKCCE